jgi:hypothetical protein
MNDEPKIPIDTSRYERAHGAPRGRRFWSFMIVSPSVTSKDHYWRTDKPETYQTACARVREIAQIRRSEMIILQPD